MLKPSIRSQLVIGAGLALLIVATRSHHFATLHGLPGASWSAFFIAGVYLRPRWVLAALLALTWALDFAAYTWGGVGAFCISPAYGFLVPAYGVLWLAGRWYARRHRFEWRTLAPLAAAALAAATVCELLSSGSFYFLSGRFAEPGLIGFGARLAQYFSADLQSLSFYLGMAAAAHGLCHLLASTRRARKAGTA